MKNTAATNGTAHDSGLGRADADFVVVDELGGFTYYPSRAAMLADFEYADEAASILDRAGNNFHLTLEEGRKLALGSSFGRVEFSWLRQAWISDRRREPQAHRLLRLYPTTLDTLLAGIFETLSLERASSATSSPWVLDVAGEETHAASLRDVDAFVARLDHLERVTVRDPFGHGYRPVRHPKHRLRVPGASPIYYVEIEPGLPPGRPVLQ